MAVRDPNKSIRIKTTRKPKARPKRTSKAKPKRDLGYYKVDLDSREEKQYQMLKLIHSGRTLGEAKAMMKAAAVAANERYMSKRDALDLLSLEGGMYRISKMNRATAKGLMSLKFAPRSITGPREEHIAKFATGYKGKVPINWRRDGNLIRRGRPNYPEPNSSKNKIGRTRVIGAKKVLKDFRNLIGTLQSLQKQHGKADMSALNKAYKSVRIAASPNKAK